jgi:hypothetical protein
MSVCSVDIITGVMDEESIMPIVQSCTDEMSKKPWRSGMEILIDVLKCPYCGHKKAEIKKRSGFRTTYYVLCGRCGARGPFENKYWEAAKWWWFA